jgi:multidrug efflux pump subunit AcrA (membrane-fusion protein)
MGDPVARTYRIRIALPDDTPLRFGMSVEANVVASEKNGALLIPADAIQAGQVLVIDGDRVRRRRIEVGIRGVRSVEVVSGLGENEVIASPAPADLADGARVRIKQAEPVKQ